MLSAIKKTITRYNRVGRKVDIFEENKEMIRQMNLETLSKVSMIGFIISILLMVSAIFVELTRTNIFEYITLVIATGIICMRSKYAMNHTKVPDQVWINLLYVAVYGFTIYTGCFLHNKVSATATCVFLVALPLFFISRPIAVNVMQFIVSAVLVIASYNNKENYVFRVDVLNTITFFTVGVAIYYHNLNSKIHEIEYRAILRNEKDTDSLTKILNRGGLESTIQKYIESDNIKPAAFLLIDIDNFKSINDHFGHDAGDKILCDAVNVMKKTFRSTDVYGRIGGDEFVIFLPQIKGEEWLDTKLEKFVFTMNKTLIGDAGAIDISVSVGAVRFPEHGETYEKLYKNADTAMYQVKNHGKSGFVIYKNEL